MNEQDTVENIASLLRRIDDLIKQFVKEVCIDLGKDDLYIRTTLEYGHYMIELFDKELNQVVKSIIMIDEFLQICGDKGKLEYRVNHDVRAMVSKFGTTKENEIVVG